MKTMKVVDAVAMLKTAGAVFERRLDRATKTVRNGWWLAGKFVAETSRDAAKAING